MESGLHSCEMQVLTAPSSKIIVVTYRTNEWMPRKTGNIRYVFGNIGIPFGSDNGLIVYNVIFGNQMSTRSQIFTYINWSVTRLTHPNDRLVIGRGH